jgi:molybdopterin-guanine dinucleotide biosynthesis protein A
MGASAGRGGQRALGVVLAGGRGSRLGGAKATARLGGRPLISHSLAALAAAGLERLVVAKAGSALPPLAVGGERDGEGTSASGGGAALEGEEGLAGEARLLIEPPRPRHPLCGIVAALRAAPGRAAVVVPCDMPFLAPALLGLLAAATEPLVVLSREGDLQPLPGRYAPALLPVLEAALGRGEPLRRTAAQLGARVLGEDELARCGDPRRLLFNVNDDADLRRAEAMLGGSVAADDPPALDRRGAVGER